MFKITFLKHISEHNSHVFLFSPGSENLCFAEVACQSKISSSVPFDDAGSQENWETTRPPSSFRFHHEGHKVVETLRSNTDLDEWVYSQKNSENLDEQLSASLKPNLFNNTTDDFVGETSQMFKPIPITKLKDVSPSSTSIEEKYETLLRQHEDLKKHLQSFQSVKIKTCMSNIRTTNFKCKECSFVFNSMSGLKNHWRRLHGSLPFPKEEGKSCPYCGKSFLYLYQHVREIHRDKLDNRCPVCKGEFMELKKHRKTCTACIYPSCTFTSTKVSRLLNHIKICKEKDKPMDLSPKKDLPNSLESLAVNYPIDLSPSKALSGLVTAPGGRQKDPQNKTLLANGKSARNQSKVTVQSDNGGNVPRGWQNESLLADGEVTVGPSNLPVQTSDVGNAHGGRHKDHPGLIADGKVLKSLHRRSHYPSDDGSHLEGYESELEDGDSREFTVERRKVKDGLESDMRIIDSQEADHYKGDEEFIHLFRSHMISNQSQKPQNQYKSDQKSTIQIYANAFKHVLKSCHRNIGNFNSMDFLDCDREKTFTIDGRSRDGDADWKSAPFTLSVDLVKDAIEHCRKTKGDSAVLGHIVSSVHECMRFIELVFIEKGSNIHGKGPLEIVRFAHTSVREYLKNTNTWGACIYESKNLAIEKKQVEQYQNPQKTLNTLKTIKDYQSSKNREQNLNKVLSDDDDYINKHGLFTELSLITMGECIHVTGECR